MQLIDLGRIAGAANDVDGSLLAAARVVDGLTNRRQLLLGEVFLAITISLLPSVASLAAQLVGEGDVLEPVDSK